jgi:cell division septum initiation protein DivIVA
MPDIEPRPIPPTIAVARSSAASSSDLIRRVAADLTPFQAVRVGKKIARRRMKTAVELARIEDETLLAEARIIAEAKVKVTQEQAERLLHGERADCLAEAALKHEETSRIIDLVQDEVAHTIFKDALKGTSSRYVSGVVQRSGS